MKNETAVIYARCSSKRQISSSSLERQYRYCKRWCQENNVDCIDTLADIGSGFHGYHLSKRKSKLSGNLGRVLEAYENKPTKAPDYFLYEAIDRIDSSYTELLNLTLRLKAVGTQLVCVGMSDFPDMWKEPLTDSEKLSLYQL